MIDERYKRRIEKICFWSLSAVTVIWFFFFMNKGIDLTDMAYYLTRYKYYFDPELNVKSMGTFLTDALGAVIYNMTDSYQVLILSICHWGLYMGSGLIVFLTLKKYVSRVLLVIAVLGGSLFSLTWVHIMNYNTTSMFIQTLSICVLIKGIEKGHAINYIISGMLFSINTFFRLPNVLEIGIGVCILWYYIFCTGERKEGIRKLGTFILGVICGCILGLTLSILIIGPEGMSDYLLRTVNTAGSGQDSHGIINILDALYTGLKSGLSDWMKYGLPVVIAILIWNLWTWKKKYGKTKDILFWILSLGLVIYGVIVAVGISSLQFFQMTALCILVLMFAGTLYFRKKDPLTSTVCMIGFCAEAILSVGTNNAWNYQAVFLIFPFSACLLAACRNKNYRSKRSLTLFAVFFVALVFGAGVNYASNYVYRDAPNKELNYYVQAEEYRAVKTSKDRAEYLDELNEVLSNLEGNELLAYGDFNVGYVISDMTPFFERIWSDLESYSLEDFDKDLQAGIEERGYPVILLADVEKDGLYRSAEKLQLIQDVMEEGNYEVYYENEWYQIYIPGQKK